MIAASRLVVAVLAASLCVAASMPALAQAGAGGGGAAGAPSGPYDIALFPSAKAPKAKGAARLVFAQSPFGVSVTADGHAVYDARIIVSGLPTPSSLGPYTTYVVWETTPDLSQWIRVGTIANGTTTVGSFELNKFLLVITAERSATARTHEGPTVLHGTSPSGWLQKWNTQPLYRGFTG